MRRFPISWTTVSTKLGLKRKRKARHRHGERARRSRIEPLEARHMLSTTPWPDAFALVSGPDDAEASSFSNESSDTAAEGSIEFAIVGGSAAEFFQIAVSKNDAGQQHAGLMTKPNASIPVGEQLDLVIESRWNDFIVRRYSLSINLMKSEFLSEFYQERLDWAQPINAAPEELSSSDLLATVKPDGTFDGLSASESLDRYLAIAKESDISGAVREQLYAGLKMWTAARKVSALPALDQPTSEKLGAIALVLGPQNQADVLSADAALAVSARELREELVRTTDSLYTLWSGYDTNHEMMRQLRNGETEEYVFTLYESGMYELRDDFFLNLDRAASIEARIELNPDRSAYSAPISFAAFLEASADNDRVTDTTVDESAPTVSYPDLETVLVSNWDNGGQSQDFQGYFNFDLNGYGSEHVTSAEVTLRVDSHAGSGTQHVAQLVMSDWEESSLTWQSSGTLAFGAQLGDPWNVAGGTTVTIDVTNAVNRALHLGDMNFSGALDVPGVVGDVQAFHTALVDPALHFDQHGHLFNYDGDLLARGDANFDGLLNAADINGFFAAVGYSLGDYNLDGIVDGGDYNVWIANWGGGWKFIQGDGSFDGQVNSSDYSVWRDRLGATSTTPADPFLSFRVSEVAPRDGNSYGWYVSSENTTYDGTNGNPDYRPKLVINQEPDLVAKQFDTFATDLRVSYNVVHDSFGELDVEVWRSTTADGSVLDAPLMERTITSASLLSIGHHEFAFEADFTAAGNGLGVDNDVDEDYFLFVRLVGRSNGQTGMSSGGEAEYSLENNLLRFSEGAFQETDGTLQIHTGDGQDLVEVSDTEIVINGGASAVGGGSSMPFDPDLVGIVDDRGDGTTQPYLVYPGGNFSSTGSWVDNGNDAYTWAGDRLYAYLSSVPLSKTATWSFPELEPGYYQVSATWQFHPSNRSLAAPFQLFDGDEYIRTHYVNQRVQPAANVLETHPVPNDSNPGPARFQHFGEPVYIESGMLEVLLSNAADGVVVADAIRIERVGFGSASSMPNQALYVRTHGGDDVVDASGYSDAPVWIFGGDGNDVLAVDAAFAEIARLYGGDGNDTLLGGAAADFLFGELGDDKLYGGGGNDTLDGGDGNDFLQGDDGNDAYSGGNGHDFYEPDAEDDLNAPTLDEIDDVTVRVGQGIAFRVFADDVEDDYSELMAGFSIDIDSETIPTSEYSFVDGVVRLIWPFYLGTHEATVTVTDGHSMTDQSVFDITVEDYNLAPPTRVFDGFVPGVDQPLYLGDTQTDHADLSVSLVSGPPSATVYLDTTVPSSPYWMLSWHPPAPSPVSTPVPEGVIDAEWYSSYNFVIEVGDDSHPDGITRTRRFEYHGGGGAEVTLDGYHLASEHAQEDDIVDAEKSLLLARNDQFGIGIGQQLSGTVDPPFYGDYTANETEFKLVDGGPDQAAVWSWNEADGTFVYQPEAGFEGVVTFQYYLDSAEGWFEEIAPPGQSHQRYYQPITSNVATVTIEVGKAVRSFLTVEGLDEEDEDTGNGKFLLLNNDDDNNNEVEDREELRGPVSGENDLTRVEVDYWLREDVTPEDFAARFMLASTLYGAVRLWTTADKEEEIIPYIVGYPHHTGQDYLLDELPSEIFVEGIAHNLGFLGLNISANPTTLFSNSVGAPPTGGLADVADQDNVNLAVINVDLDIDSDNDDGFGLPDGSNWEETLEVHEYGLGKLIMLDNPTRDFTIVVLRLAPNLDPNDPNLSVRIDWDFASSAGYVRLWTRYKNDPQRTSASVQDGGHQINAGVEYSLSDLLYDPVWGTIELFAEISRISIPHYPVGVLLKAVKESSMPGSSLGTINPPA